MQTVSEIHFNISSFHRVKMLFSNKFQHTARAGIQTTDPAVQYVRTGCKCTIQHTLETHLNLQKYETNAGTSDC